MLHRTASYDTIFPPRICGRITDLCGASSDTLFCGSCKEGRTNGLSVFSPALPTPPTPKVSEVENKVAALIISNQISARIDSTNATLHAKHTEQRGISCRKV